MSTNVCEDDTSADEFCTKLLTSLQKTLDEVAPVQSIKKRCTTPGHFTLSEEALSAKAHRRW